MVIVVMGVAGAGKTTVGRRLAGELGWVFHDADELHPPANIEHMRSGAPLNDAQREPWLAALAALIGEHAQSGTPMVLACSALTRAYRRALLAAVPREPAGAPSSAHTAAVRFVHLDAPPELLEERLAQRAGHFFPPSLLDSQMAALEPPSRDAAVVEPVPKADTKAAADVDEADEADAAADAAVTLDAARPPAELVSAIRAAFGV
jgi:gluconokinase